MRYIDRCHDSLKVSNQIPKGAVISVAVTLLRRLISQALERGSELVRGRLLSFGYWNLGLPGGVM